MIFNKEDFSFLSMYAKCSDTKMPQNDKFRIKASKEKQNVVFEQFSDNIFITTTLNKTVDKDLEVKFPVNQFLAFINSVPVNSEIDIQENGIHFNKNRYEFETIDLSSVFSGTEMYYTMIADQANTKTTISNFGLIKNSLTGADGFDCTLLKNGYFISEPIDSAIISVYKTTNDKNICFNIPKIAGVLALESKLDSVDFYLNGKYKFIVIGTTYIFFGDKDYNLPDVFEEDTVKQYDHSTKIEIPKNAFKDMLNRIKIFSAKNIYTRVVASSTNNQFVIESKEPNSGYAIEKIDADIDSELKEQEKLFFIPQTDLSTAVNNLKGDKIIIHTNVYSPDEVAVKITDELNEDFFIICLLPE